MSYDLIISTIPNNIVESHQLKALQDALSEWAEKIPGVGYFLSDEPKERILWFLDFAKRVSARYSVLDL